MSSLWYIGGGCLRYHFSFIEVMLSSCNSVHSFGKHARLEGGVDVYPSTPTNRCNADTRSFQLSLVHVSTAMLQSWLIEDCEPDSAVIPSFTHLRSCETVDIGLSAAKRITVD